MGEPNQKDYLTPYEVADLLRVSRATVYKLIKSGKLTGIKVSGKRLFPRSELTALLGDSSYKQKPKIASSPELEQARQELKQADEMRRKGIGKKTIEAVKPLQKIFNAAHDAQGLAYAQFVEGGGLLNMGAFAKASHILEKALENVRTVDDPLLEGMIYATLASAEGNRGKFDQTLGFYNQALNLFTKVKAKDKTAVTLQNLGGFYKRLNRPVEALFHYKRALELARTVRMPRQFEPTIYLALSDTHSILGDNEQALAYAQKAWHIAQKRKDLSLMTLSTNGIARCQYNLGDFAGARQFFQISFDYWNRIEPGRKEAFISLGINSLIGLEDYKACVQLLEKQSQLPRFKTGQSPEEPWRLLNYAKCYIGLDRPEIALDYAHQALGKQIDLGQIAALWRIYAITGECYAGMGKFDAACENYGKALFYLEGEIDQAREEGFPAHFNYFISEYSDRLADSASLLSDIEKALDYSFRLIALPVRRIIAAADIYPDPLRARAVARKYVRVTANIVDFFNRAGKFVPGRLTPFQIKVHQERFTGLRKKKDELVAELAQENPLYLPLQGEEGPTLEGISRLYAENRIPQDARILVLCLSKSKGHGFVVRNKGVLHRRSLSIGREEAGRLISILIASCQVIGLIVESGSAPSLAEQQNIKEILRVLYERLVKPFEESIDPNEPLIIITDNSLTFLPFQALYNGKKYLCEYLSVHQLLSPAFLRNLYVADRGKVRRPQRLLVVSPWPEADAEKALDFVSDLPAENITFKSGEEAQAPVIRPLIAKHDNFLYLGDISNAGNPKTESLRMHSGLGLTAYELFTQRYNLDKTKSVILYTGGLEEPCKAGTGEFFLPMQRGFMTSGANMVASFLWKMDLSSLCKALRAIYSNLDSQGIIGPESIRKAQVNLISQSLTSHPYFWAGILIQTLTINKHDV